MKRFNILFIGLFMLYTQLSFADDCDGLGNCDVRNICIKMEVEDCLQGGSSFSSHITSKTLRASVSKDYIAQKQVISLYGYINPNTFKNINFNGGELFNICYVERNVDHIFMKNNYWDGMSSLPSFAYKIYNGASNGNCPNFSNVL